MTKESRQKMIVDLVVQHGSIQVTELAKLCNVSLVTIRKDLAELEKMNKLYRNNCKAIVMNPYVNNRNVFEKEKLYSEEQRIIGEYAATLVEPGDSIAIASGTSVHALARAIQQTEGLTVVTSSLEVSTILAQKDSIDIIQLGGVLRHSSHSVVGKFAEQALSEFLCNKFFMGVDGIDLELGLTTTNIMEASLNRVMMNTAQKTIVLADSSKFGKMGFSKITDIDNVDQIITDSHIKPQTASAIEDLGIKLTIVDVSGENVVTSLD